MHREILASRRRAVIAAVNAFPGGRECAATHLGLDLKRFDNQLYENPGHRPLCDEQVAQLERLAGTTLLVDYLCALYGGVFVPMPAAEQLDNIDLYARAITTAVQRGQVDKLIADAGVAMTYKVGTMIEIPRAALTADEIAKEAEFFSFG